MRLSPGCWGGPRARHRGERARPGRPGLVRAPARTEDRVPGEARGPFVPGPREARRCEQMGRVPPRARARAGTRAARDGGCSPTRPRVGEAAPPRAPRPSPPECPPRPRPTEGGALTQHLRGHVGSSILFPYSLSLKPRNPLKAREVCMLPPPFACFCFILLLHVFPLLRGVRRRRVRICLRPAPRARFRPPRRRRGPE